MSLQLIQDDTFWKKVDTNTGGWSNGVFVNNITTTYEELSGVKDPYQLGEKSFSLPEGVGSSDAYLLYTDEDLKVHKSLPSGSNLADVLIFKYSGTDDDYNSVQDEYTVWDKMDWGGNTGFTLISSTYEYLVVRSNLI